VKNKLHDLYPDIDKDKLVFKFESITIGHGVNPATGKSYDIQLDENGSLLQPTITVTVTGTANVTGQSTETIGATDPAEVNGTEYTFTFTIPAVDVTGTADISATGSANTQQLNDEIVKFINEMIGAINKRYGAGSDVDKALAELVNVLNQVTELEDDIDGMIADYQKRVDNFLTRLNNKLVGWLERSEEALQPTVIVSANSKMGLLSQSKYKPTKTTTSELTLFPTSYSLEIFAPAFKKFVAVTDVLEANTLNRPANYETLARNANGTNMAEVYDGRKKCTLSGQKGYIYEVTYAALDFHGKICVNKYYVQFK